MIKKKKKSCTFQRSCNSNSSHISGSWLLQNLETRQNRIMFSFVWDNLLLMNCSLLLKSLLLSCKLCLVQQPTKNIYFSFAGLPPSVVTDLNNSESLLYTIHYPTLWRQFLFFEDTGQPRIQKDETQGTQCPSSPLDIGTNGPVYLLFSVMLLGLCLVSGL